MYSVEEAKEIEKEIVNLCSELEDNERAVNYVESVQDKSSDIMTSIEDRGEATEKQIQALTNMKNGLQKWIR